MDELSVAEVLERAADLIEPEGAWTRESYARDSDGLSLGAGYHSRATCWCAVGALEKVTGTIVPNALVGPIYGAIGFRRFSDLTRWNDAPGRTQAEVVAKLREAARLARSPAQGEG